jgi:hypothetical protein
MHNNYLQPTEGSWTVARVARKNFLQLQWNLENSLGCRAVNRNGVQWNPLSDIPDPSKMHNNYLQPTEGSWTVARVDKLVGGGNLGATQITGLMLSQYLWQTLFVNPGGYVNIPWEGSQIYEILTRPVISYVYYQSPSAPQYPTFNFAMIGEPYIQIVESHKKWTYCLPLTPAYPSFNFPRTIR